ncbi:esterase/lipase-like protein, partial [human gut metagenome]
MIPAVESKYSTYAESVTKEGLEASRDHRGFGGFSMGSVNTWNTFRYCMDYFRYFMPMSGSYSTDGQYMADLVRQQGYGSDDFLSSLLLEQVILHIMHLKLKSWQWRRIQMECL